MALTDNLISYWKLDEASGNFADSVGSNTGTPTGIDYGATHGKINGGAGFGAGTDVIDINGQGASSGFPSGSNACTVAMWVKFVDLTISDEGLFGYGTASSGQARLFAMEGGTATTKKMNFGKYGGNASGFSNTALSTAQWYFLTWTIDGSGNIAYYVNGSADGTATITGLNTTVGGYAYIGLSYPAGGTNASADIDEVGIWARALSSGEISSLYNGGTGLQYPFTQSSETPRRRIITG